MDFLRGLRINTLTFSNDILTLLYRFFVILISVVLSYYLYKFVFYMKYDIEFLETFKQMAIFFIFYVLTIPFSFGIVYVAINLLMNKLDDKFNFTGGYNENADYDLDSYGEYNNDETIIRRQPKRNKPIVNNDRFDDDDFMGGETIIRRQPIRNNPIRRNDRFEDDDELDFEMYEKSEDESDIDDYYSRDRRR